VARVWGKARVDFAAFLISRNPPMCLCFWLAGWQWAGPTPLGEGSPFICIWFRVWETTSPRDAVDYIAIRCGRLYRHTMWSTISPYDVVDYIATRCGRLYRHAMWSTISPHDVVDYIATRCGLLICPNRNRGVLRFARHRCETSWGIGYLENLKVYLMVGGGPHRVAI
jgi:hypothetical protein